MCAYISFISRNLQWAFCQLNLLYSLPVPLLKYLIPNTTFLSHFQAENNESDSLCLSSPRMTITYSCDWHILTQGENNVYFPLTLFSPRVRITTALFYNIFKKNNLGISHPIPRSRSIERFNLVFRPNLDLWIWSWFKSHLISYSHPSKLVNLQNSTAINSFSNQSAEAEPISFIALFKNNFNSSMLINVLSKIAPGVANIGF